MLQVVVRAALMLTMVGSPALAQGRNTDDVPPGHRPPAGMCRIWIDGVPPGQQAAPTDCATAVRNRPANGRVIFGDENAKPGKGSRSFQPSRLRNEGEKAPTAATTKSEDRDEARKEKAKKSRSKTKDTKKKSNPNDI